MRLVACLGIVLGGCYAPTLPAGAPCATGRLCPDGLTCTSTPTGDLCLAGPIGLDAPAGDGGGDAPASDASLASCPRTLLAGGRDVAAQGWIVDSTGAGGTITYAAGVTQLETKLNSRQLLVLPAAVDPAGFVLEVDLAVDVSGGFTANDAAAVLLSSYHPPAGDAADQSFMLSFAVDNVGYGTGAGVRVGLDASTKHTYRVAIDANQKLTVTIGGLKISKSPVATNGTIAIGDPSTTPGFDSRMQIFEVRRLCLP